MPVISAEKLENVCGNAPYGIMEGFKVVGRFVLKIKCLVKNII